MVCLFFSYGYFVALLFNVRDQVIALTSAMEALIEDVSSKCEGNMNISDDSNLSDLEVLPVEWQENGRLLSVIRHEFDVWSKVMKEFVRQVSCQLA